MRQVAQAKLGYYPLSPEAARLLAAHLRRAGEAADTAVLDPCCGQGEAVKIVADALGLPMPSVYGIELSEGRAALAREALPGARVLGPCTFHGSNVSYNTFGLAYVNPPFDDEPGGGRREELAFFTRACYLAAPGGTVALVLPEPTLMNPGRPGQDLRRAISCRLDQVGVYRLPEAIRKFRECVVLGVKREHPLPGDKPKGPLAGPAWSLATAGPALGEDDRTWPVVAAGHPRLWSKKEFTPEELAREVGKSPMAKHLAPPPPKQPASPPRPLGKGHVALMLASGQLDGAVEPPDEEPHVVRGTATKKRILDDAKSEAHENADGSVTTKTVYVEKIGLTVRAVGGDGVILDFADAPKEQAR